MKKIAITALIFFAFLLSFEHTSAETRGIGVSPSKIILSGEESYPVSIDVTITNFSESREWVEISFSKNLAPFALAEPGRFALEGGSARKIKVVFDQPKSLKDSGVIRISASRTSAQGFSTGTGIEIPVVWESGSVGSFNSLLGANVLSATGEAFKSASVKIAFLVLIGMLLWKLSKFLVKNSDKETFN